MGRREGSDGVTLCDRKGKSSVDAYVHMRKISRCALLELMSVYMTMQPLQTLNSYTTLCLKKVPTFKLCNFVKI